MISLTLEPYYVDKVNYDAWSNSFVLLLIGWIGMIMGGGAAISWLANPFIFLSWLFIFKKIKVSVFFSIISFILAFSFLFFDKVITSEAPTFSKIKDYKIGYWIWLISIFIFSMGSVIIFILEERLNKKNELGT
jgi:hypothetical protein